MSLEQSNDALRTTYKLNNVNYLPLTWTFWTTLVDDTECKQIKPNDYKEGLSSKDSQGSGDKFVRLERRYLGWGLITTLLKLYVSKYLLGCWSHFSKSNLYSALYVINRDTLNTLSRVCAGLLREIRRLLQPELTYTFRMNVRGCLKWNVRMTGSQEIYSVTV